MGIAIDMSMNVAMNLADYVRFAGPRVGAGKQICRSWLLTRMIRGAMARKNRSAPQLDRPHFLDRS